jgi:uncharacterized protein YecE (DUF72 family)
MSKFYVGTSGWQFEGWRNDFFPKGLVQKKELGYLSNQVNSIEINGTFYSLQRPTSFEKWYEETPKGFVFSIKGNNFITHIKRLNNVEEGVCNFMASGLFNLKEKLGPFLWQFPPSMQLDMERFKKFFELLPFDSKAAQKLAKKHTAKVEGRSVTKAHGDFPIRHSVEVRHPSFMVPEFIDLLREYNIALVFGHSGGPSQPYVEDLTSDFIYARMHGQEAKYKDGYGEKFVTNWSQRVKTWMDGKQPKDAECLTDTKPKSVKRDVFIYFDTEAKATAPFDAVTLLRLLS